MNTDSQEIDIDIGLEDDPNEVISKKKTYLKLKRCKTI